MVDLPCDMTFVAIDSQCRPKEIAFTIIGQLLGFLNEDIYENNSSPTSAISGLVAVGVVTLFILLRKYDSGSCTRIRF